MKRLLIFSHFNQQGILSAYVVFILEKFRPLFERVVFVSNSRLDEEAKRRLLPFTDSILERGNAGFDFGAWKQAITEEGWEIIESFDVLTLMNDTCFGPLFEMDEIFGQMEKPEIDFWGFTNHRATNSGMPGSGGAIPEHLQSYFLSFNKRVTNSDDFQTFWRNVSMSKKVEEVIQQCETQLTGILTKAGYRYAAYFDTIKTQSDDVNISIWQPNLLIQNRVPLIKIKSFIFFPYPYHIKRLIQEQSNYPVNYIDNHISNVYNPSTSIKIAKKNIVVSEVNDVRHNLTLNVAVHVHVYYIEIFEKIIDHLNRSNIDFELFVTTDNEDKRTNVVKSIDARNMSGCLKKIQVFKNRGRDVLPWLSLANELSRYDVVGHFHTKKTNWAAAWIGESWMDDIIELLIDPGKKIVAQFEINNKLGIVIPDIPFYFKRMPEANWWAGNRQIIEEILTKIRLKKKVEICWREMPVMPYGNMFWYRPKALEPLFDLGLSVSDFLEEPLHVDGTISHALERLPVYVAWGQGYDFRIAVSLENGISGFEFFIHSKVAEKFNSLYNSNSYKIGRITTWLPSKIKSHLRKRR